MTLTPFATSRSVAGCHLADVVLGRDRGADRLPTSTAANTARSSEESYDPQRERQLWDAVERFTAAYTV